MSWTWKHHLFSLCGIISIVLIVICLGVLIGDPVKTQSLPTTEVRSTSLTTPNEDEYADTDQDKLPNGEEKTRYHTNPSKSDTDDDGLTDYEEVAVYYTDPLKFDTNGNGYSDSRDVFEGFSPTLPGRSPLADVDTDGDGLFDAIELRLGTDLGKSDTDADGLSDKEEVYLGNNPVVFGDDRATVERHVEVDLTHQQFYYFMNGVQLGTMPVSTGLPSKATPKGEFKILRKVPITRYVGREPGDEYDLPNVKWNLEFKPKFFLHSAYWHKQFGIRAMSHGCVNMRIEDAEIIYKFLDIGDKVIVYGKTPVGKVKKDDVIISTPTPTPSTSSTTIQ